jgi:hypothetical protein
MHTRQNNIKHYYIGCHDIKMTPNYVTITIGIILNFTPFECLSLIYNSEDKKTKIILILKTCLKMYIISQSKYEN